MDNFKIILPHEGINEIPKGYRPLVSTTGKLIAIVPKGITEDDFLFLEVGKAIPEINWEQRRFEVAKSVISGMLTNRISPPDKTIANDCETAIKYANEIINQLKS